jgi:polysaccharide deacetylase family protein (PEP-CTERM system associated)
MLEDPRVLNAITVDLEDWYQGLEIPRECWHGYESRVVSSARRLLSLLAETDVRATFFTLGDVAERHPDLVREISNAGHEIGTHGESHEFVYRLTPDSFRAEISRMAAVLCDLTGREVLGHRAPFFSVTRESLWALDVLAELGFRYDSSIFPVHNYRYGIPDAPRWPHRVSATNRLVEFPISTWRVLGTNLPIAGGAYFRIYPYAITRMGLRSLNRAGHPAVFYLHPWELDPDHPRIPVPRRIAATHYFNLSATECRLRRLLRDFRFAPASEVLGVA